MPGPFTVKNTGSNPGPPLATFDDDGNLRLTGEVYVDGTPSLDNSQVTGGTAPSGGDGDVTSVFSRTGAITAESGDYTVSQVTGAAPLASPAFTDTPTAPTAAAGTDTTQVATTAFVGGAVLLSTPYQVYLPSGDDSGATDIDKINTYLANGDPLQLGATYASPYYIKTPILPISQSRMWGTQWWSASSYDAYGAGTGAPGGTLIQMTDDFSGDYAIYMFNNSSTDQFYGVDLAGFTVYGGAAPEGGGILLDGAWGAGFLRGIAILQCQGDLLHFAADDTSGKVPDDWQVLSCKFSGGAAGGIYTDDTPDSWFVNCESSQNSAHNWDMNYSVNTRLIACKGEGSDNGAGFHFGGNGAGDIVTLIGCTTQYNAEDGFLFDNAAGGGLGTYQLDGCASTHDNQAASTYAGFRADGSLARIMGVGCTAQGAAYGAYEGGTSYGMCFTGSYFSGTTAATHDDGTNTHVLVNQEPVPW